MTAAGPVDTPRTGQGEDVEDWPFQAEGAPEFQPIARVDTLVRCARCWAVLEGNVGAQTGHRVWHKHIERDIARARTALPQRYAGSEPSR